MLWSSNTFFPFHQTIPHVCGEFNIACGNFVVKEDLVNKHVTLAKPENLF